ncbi:MAG TPA: hypothetical protein VGG75_08435 [Trebonia sp.]
MAGFETTVNLIGNGTVALLRDREQREKLVADPSLAAEAVAFGRIHGGRAIRRHPGPHGVSELLDARVSLGLDPRPALLGLARGPVL